MLVCVVLFETISAYNIIMMLKKIRIDKFITFHIKISIISVDNFHYNPHNNHNYNSIDSQFNNFKCNV